MMGRRLAKLALGLGVAFGAGLSMLVVAEFAWAYLRTPRLVENIERTTSLQINSAELSDNRRRWLLLVDDPAFFRHHGIDGRTPGAGYTTITQGIVKILFFGGFKPGLFRWRKLNQSIIAIAFDLRVPKEEQLSLFLNIAYLGSPHGEAINGFGTASEVYFGKSFDELSDDEYLKLVAMIVAPDRFDPLRHPAQNDERVMRIKRLLAGRCAPLAVSDVEYSDCAQ